RKPLGEEDESVDSPMATMSRLAMVLLGSIKASAKERAVTPTVPLCCGRGMFLPACAPRRDMLFVDRNALPMNKEKEGSDPSGHRDKLDTETKPVIVAIGASAGGVQALQAFIGALPDKSGAAYVVIVHLDPEKRSELSSILGLRTRMPVVEVEDN